MIYTANVPGSSFTAVVKTLRFPDGTCEVRYDDAFGCMTRIGPIPNEDIAARMAIAILRSMTEPGCTVPFARTMPPRIYEYTT